MLKGEVSPRHVRDVIRCEGCVEMMVFEQFLENRDSMVRLTASQIVAMNNPDLVVQAIMKENDRFVLCGMIGALKEVRYKDVDVLTVLLREDDSGIARRYLRCS